MPATTVNKVCLSGLNTIYLADLMINAGDADIVVAGGMESMTQAPYLLPGARAGYRLGDGKLVDSMMYDGLFCAFDHVRHGARHRALQRQPTGVARERQDAFAAASHERAAAAIKDGKFADEIVPVSVPQRKGDPLVVDTDEGVRPETTAESLAKLGRRSTRTAPSPPATPSQISDGGAAVIVMSKAKAEQLGVTPLGELVGYGQVAGPDTVAAPPAVPRHQGGAGQGGPGRSGTSTSSRSTRPSPPWAGLDRRPRRQRGHRQRQRRGHRPRPPGRHVGHPGGPHLAARAQAPGRRDGGR